MYALILGGVALLTASVSLYFAVHERGLRAQIALHHVEKATAPLVLGLENDRLATGQLRDAAQDYLTRGQESWHKIHSARGGRATAKKDEEPEDPGWSWPEYQRHLERQGARIPAVETRLGWH